MRSRLELKFRRNVGLVQHLKKIGMLNHNSFEKLKCGGRFIAEGVLGVFLEM